MGGAGDAPSVYERHNAGGIKLPWWFSYRYQLTRSSTRFLPRAYAVKARRVGTCSFTGAAGASSFQVIILIDKMEGYTRIRGIVKTVHANDTAPYPVVIISLVQEERKGDTY